MFKKPMKMRDLEVWGTPSYIVDIWEKNYSPCLMAVQEEAVRNYGVLDYEENKGLPRHCAPRNDRGMDSRFRGNDPGKARLYGAGIKGSGNDIRDTE